MRKIQLENVGNLKRTVEFFMLLKVKENTQLFIIFHIHFV